MHEYVKLDDVRDLLADCYDEGEEASQLYSALDDGLAALPTVKGIAELVGAKRAAEKALAECRRKLAALEG